MKNAPPPYFTDNAGNLHTLPIYRYIKWNMQKKKKEEEEEERERERERETMTTTNLRYGTVTASYLFALEDEARNEVEGRQAM